MIRGAAYWLDAGSAGICRAVVLEALDGPLERVRVMLPAGGADAELVVPCSLLTTDHPLRTAEARRARAPRIPTRPRRER